MPYILNNEFIQNTDLFKTGMWSMWTWSMISIRTVGKWFSNRDRENSNQNWVHGGKQAALKVPMHSVTDLRTSHENIQYELDT